MRLTIDGFASYEDNTPACRTSWSTEAGTLWGTVPARVRKLKRFSSGSDPGRSVAISWQRKERARLGGGGCEPQLA